MTKEEAFKYLIVAVEERFLNSRKVTDYEREMIAYIFDCGRHWELGPKRSLLEDVTETGGNASEND